jgi:hypothetical protein
LLQAYFDIISFLLFVLFMEIADAYNYRYTLKGTAEGTCTLLVHQEKGRGGRTLELPDVNKN